MNDVSGGAAAPAQKARLPDLGPAFLSEEDAAYWVHTRIPANPDREYGSVILRRPDGKFLATRPVPGARDRFDFGNLIEVDPSGHYVHPKGYTCVANVHSHPPLYDEVRRANPGQDETALRLFINFFSDMDFIADVAKRQFFRSAYLCGPDGTLLKYSPSGSTQEFSYYLWLKAGAPRDNPDGAFGVINIIRKIASLGELRVIVSSADWGHSTGLVPLDWQPGKAIARGVTTGSALMTRVCGSAQRAVLAALKVGGANTRGLVLKKLAGREYVATHARAATGTSWAPEHFFPSTETGELRLPAGYALDGFYYASRPDPASTPADQPWLYEQFFTPAEMALAIACRARNAHLTAPDRPLSLYMQAMDSALLKYSFSGSDAEAAMSIQHPDGTMDDAGLHARMLAGTLRPREYVSILTLAGRIEVLRGSPLWASVGPVELDWAPFAGFAWPTLGPAFLSADDAARYVHEQIDSRRDRRYAGYILQRSDKRFVPTEPLEADINALRLGQLYPRDKKGSPIFPDDHVLHGHYVAHEALSLLDPVKVERLKWSWQEAALSLQMVSAEETRQALFDEVPLYVSGSQDSLVRFSTVNTAKGQALDKRLGKPDQPGPLVVGLDSGAIRPADFIREQASAGLLTVLVDSKLWGPRGTLSPSWSVPAMPWGWRRPEQVAFGAVFRSADEAAQDRYARDRGVRDEQRPWFGFILKHQEREEYIATELVAVDSQTNNVFQLQGVFGVKRTAPWYQYPEGFSRYAAFYAGQRVEPPSSKPDAWLVHYFMPLDDLFIACEYARRGSVTESRQPIPLYLSTRDGALLKYVRRHGSQLFAGNKPELSLDAIKANLSSGKLLPADFVRVVANSGELSVLRTSLCWDRALPVELNWRPFMNLERRSLGPVCQTADDAVICARSQVPDSFGKVLGGLVLQRRDGLFIATDPIEVTREDFDVNEIYPDASVLTGMFPSNCLVTGRYRTRVAKELPLVLTEIEKQIYLNMLSVDTLYTAYARPSDRVLDEYLFGPDGSLIRYRSGLLSRMRADLSNALNDFKRLPNDLDGQRIKQLIHDRVLKPSVWVDSLVKSGYLQVVTGSRLWGPPGPVTKWAPYSAATPPLDYAKAKIYPVCSPAFLQADAAARYVHEALEQRIAQTFGCILWSAWNSLYIASLPTDAQHSLFALDRVLPRANPIDGFTLDSLYLRAQAAPEGTSADEWRQHFFAPMDVHHLCARANTHQGYKPIYFSCADGALLKFEMAAFEPGQFLDRFGQVELRTNSFASFEQASNDERDLADGHFDLPNYVWRMAQAGKLEVIETSQYWSRHGQVDQDWQPRLADASSDERWRAKPEPSLGPVFQHVDDAARYLQTRVGSADDNETGYESAVLAKASLQRYVPLEPIAYSGYGDSPALRIFRSAKDPSNTWKNPAPRYPDGYTLVASHQFILSGNTTLAPDAEQVLANFPSAHQVYLHTHALKEKGFEIKDYYFSTLHGVLLKYTAEYTHAEKALLLTEPVVFKQGRWVAQMTPGEFISRLSELGDLRVLVAGPYWQQTGRLGAQWKTRRQQPPGLGVVRQRDEL